MRTHPGPTAFLFVLCFCFATASAEPGDRPTGHSPANRAAVLTDILTERLSLTPNQQSRIREISERHATRVDVAAANYKRSELKKQIKQLSVERDEAFREVLTEKQFAMWQDGKRAILKSMKERVRGTTDPN